MDMDVATPPQELVFLSTYLPTLLPANLSLECKIILNVLMARFLPDHWHCHTPERGSGYRAISFEPCRRDGFLDPVLVAVAQAAGWSGRQLRKSIIQGTGDRGRDGWTVFVDPGCVCVRGAGPDLRELWGTLPQHLKSPSHIPSLRSAVQFRTQSSPVKMEPQTVQVAPFTASSSPPRNTGFVQMGVIPPTPLAHEDESITGKPASPSPSKLSSSAELMKPSPDTIPGFTGPIKPLQLLAPFTLRPMDASEPETQEDGQADPFQRPSSRSSSGSGSEEYASDGSLFSRLSSALSEATAVSGSGSPCGLKGTAVSFTPSQGILRNKPSQMLLSLHRSSASLNRLPSPDWLTSGSTSPSDTSVPGSPRKQPSQIRNKTTFAPINHRHSSSHGLILKDGPGTVTEHSGGKVGVMGGGVLLGLPKSVVASPLAEGNTDSTPAASITNESKLKKRAVRRCRVGAPFAIHQPHWSGSGLSISSISSFASGSSASSPH